MSVELHGTGVGGGIAVGPVLRMPEPLPEPEDTRHAGDAEAEYAAVQRALSAVAHELRATAAAVGGQGQEVLEAAAMMVQDPSLADDVNARIQAGMSGQRAVFEAFAVFQDALIATGGLFAQRATDLRDACQRVIARLRGVSAPGVPVSDTAFILVAPDLAPADTAQLDLDRVLGLICRDGGPTSHTAILARARSIPAIVGVAEALELRDGTVVILDAAAGLVTSGPSEAAIAAAHDRIAAAQSRAAAALTGGALADGTRVALLANIGSVEDAAAAVALGAEGVGLLRTEFLFLGTTGLGATGAGATGAGATGAGTTGAPTVQHQQERYTQLLEHFPGRTVVVRVFDAGADKPLSFLGGAHEPNPALGLRGLRALRAGPHGEQILREQLQALAAAQEATRAELWVMAPMVADAEESQWFVSLGKQLGLRTVGVMAEVPSLALLSDQVVSVADFVSIGTNDLTQYALAADRMLGSLSGYQDPWHPAVLRLVKLMADAGAASGTPVGVCGEAAADPRLAVVLVGLGATSLSMTPAALAEVRAELAAVSREQAHAMASAALSATTAAGAREAAARVLTEWG